MTVGIAIVPWAYADYAPHVSTVVVRYMSIMIPAMFVGALLNAVLQGHLQFLEWNALRVGQPLLYLSLISLWAGFADIDPTVFVYSGLTAGLILLPITMLTVRRRLDLKLRRPRAGEFRPLARYSLSVHAAASIGVLNGRLDQMLIATLLSPSDLGLLVVAIGLGGAPIMLSSTIGSLAYPKIAAQATVEARSSVLGRYLRLSFAISALAGISIALVAPLLIRLLFGPPFAPAATVATLLALASITAATRGMIATGLKASGAPGLVIRMAGAALTLNGLCLALLVPSFGLVGAGIARLVVESAVCIYAIALAGNVFKTDAARLFWPSQADWALIRSDAARIAKGRFNIG